jgi:hypothetical protein
MWLGLIQYPSIKNNFGIYSYTLHNIINKQIEKSYNALHV